MPETDRLFLDRSREFLAGDYLPKIERSVALLRDEQLWWRANEASNSVGNLVLHLSGNVRQWLVSGLGGAPDARERQLEFDERGPVPRGDLLDGLRAAVREAAEVLDAFDARRLHEPHAIQGREVTAFEAVYHVVEHFAMHTGQIILLAKALAGTDLAFYDFDAGVPRPRWGDGPGE
jgi:uncharacterized damage-inducible protein DinB